LQKKSIDPLQFDSLRQTRGRIGRQGSTRLSFSASASASASSCIVALR
jgi:hypothetical protein